MKEITTSELNITAYQRNAIAVERKDNICIAILNTGIEVNIVCETSKDASDVANTILYYPTEKDNSAHEFRFKFTIKIFP